MTDDVTHSAFYLQPSGTVVPGGLISVGLPSPIFGLGTGPHAAATNVVAVVVGNFLGLVLAC